MSLQGHKLTYNLGAKLLVQDVSLTLEAGQILAVVGANGAGKSTLLRLLAGEIQPTSGEVRLEDKPLSQWNKSNLARIRSILPQSSALNFGFTVIEVALMGRTPHLRGSERPEDYAIVREALAVAHVAHLANRAYTTLSGGERQRVQLARVLAQIWQDNGPRYLLLDEPTNNLDLAHQHGTLEIAAHFAHRQVGVLAILHDLNLAAQYANQIAVMKNGQILASGTPSQTLTPSLIQEAFQTSVMVQPHPYLDCPLVIAIPQNTLKENLS